MALSPTDSYYRAETTPASVTALGRGLRAAYGRPADAFGAKGNLTHYSGYHRSRAWILNSPDSRYGSGDYSVTQTLDKGGAASDVSAFDFTPGDWGSAENRRRMIELTSRVLTAARARDPRLANLREFAGTLNGRDVITFNCSDGSLKSPFDSSHLDHVHGSFWRSRAGNDHTGLLEILLGDDMAALDTNDPSYRNLIYTVSALAQGTDVQASAGAGGPTVNITNQVARQLARLEAAAAADETRDQAVLAAVRALTVATGNDPQPILDAIAAAAANTHAVVVQLQQQLADVQARGVRLAAALAAAGGALDDADDPVA